MKFLVLLLLVISSSITWAQKIKLATIVPKGTSWAKTLKKMSQEIKKKTDGKVKFKIYYGFWYLFRGAFRSHSNN